MKVTTEKIVGAYSILADAKITKMEDADKYKVIKMLRSLRGVALAFEEFRQDAVTRLRGEEHEKMVELADQWRREGEKTTLTEDERRGVNMYFAEYNRKVEECLRDEADKENDLEFEVLTEEAFGKLVASNDWTVRQIMEVEEVLL